MRRNPKFYKLVGIVSLVLAACVIGTIIYIVNRSATNATIGAQRKHVFCDLLKPEMSREEVRNVLTQFGFLEEHENPSPGGYLSVRAYYTDPEVDRQFGGYFVLSFIDGRFQGVAIPAGLGEYVSACANNGQR